MPKTKIKTPQPFDTVGFIMDFEGGEVSDKELAIGFQHLINSGEVWSLQGMYGRTASSLIQNGYCMLGKYSTKDYYGNHIRSRYDSGDDIGSPAYVKEQHPEIFEALEEAGL